MSVADFPLLVKCNGYNKKEECIVDFGNGEIHFYGYGRENLTQVEAIQYAKKRADEGNEFYQQALTFSLTKRLKV